MAGSGFLGQIYRSGPSAGPNRIRSPQGLVTKDWRGPAGRIRIYPNRVSLYRAGSLIRLDIAVSNEGARAAQREIRAFLSRVQEKVAAAPSDSPTRSASAAYVVLAELLTQLTTKIAAQDGRTGR